MRDVLNSPESYSFFLYHIHLPFVNEIRFQRRGESEARNTFYYWKVAKNFIGADC